MRIRNRCGIVAAAAIAALSHLIGPAQAGLLDRPADAARSCGDAIAQAESRYAALPPQLLYAISEVESGRVTADGASPRPWPWTVQADNQSHYFPDKAAAVAWVRHAQAQGIASIDVGCMQVNLMYHPAAFRNLDEAFDPAHNVDYAARFLIALHAEAGDWRLAAGRYHSQTVALALPYRQRVEAILAETGGAAPLPDDSPVQELQAAWGATLQTGAAAGRPAELTGNWSSLMPRQAARRRARRTRDAPVLLSDAH